MSLGEFKHQAERRARQHGLQRWQHIPQESRDDFIVYNMWL
jgi:hypothetical protein